MEVDPCKPPLQFCIITYDNDQHTGWISSRCSSRLQLSNICDSMVSRIVSFSRIETLVQYFCRWHVCIVGLFDFEPSDQITCWFSFTNCWIYMSIFLCARFDIGGSSAHAKRAVYSYLDGLRLCDMLFWGHSILFCVHFVCEGDWICERVRGLPCSRLIWSHVENLRKKYFDFETICNPSMTTWSLTFSRYTPRLLSIPESLGDQSGNQYVSHILLLQKKLFRVYQ